MGLTIHYAYKAPAGTTAAQASAIVTRLHGAAERLRQAYLFGAVWPIRDWTDTLLAERTHPDGRSVLPLEQQWLATQSGCALDDPDRPGDRRKCHASRVFAFTIEVGDGCEPASSSCGSAPTVRRRRVVARFGSSVKSIDRF